jgi:hypothetical protein
MDTPFWWFMVGGAMTLAFGLAVLFDAVPGRSRHQAWGPLAFGASSVLSGLARLRNLPGEDWVRWTAVALMSGAVILLYRSHRRETPRPRTPRPSAQ